MKTNNNASESTFMHTLILTIEFVAACVRYGSRMISSRSTGRPNEGSSRSFAGAGAAAVVRYENAS